jgi:HK97 family phage portal protein
VSIFGALEKRNSGLADSWYYPGGSFFGGSSGGTATKSGTSVSEFNAMRLAVVWACIKILSEDSASLPLHLYRRRKGGGQDKATDDYRYALLHSQPNPEMTAMSYRETMMAHLVSWGNCYSEIERTGGRINRIKYLWPMIPNRTTPKRSDKWKIVYEYVVPKTGEKITLPKEKVLHVPGLGFNGLMGYSAIQAHRETVGLGMAYQEFDENFFGNGMHPGVVVKHPSKLSEIGSNNLRHSLTDKYAGLGQMHKLMVLEEGMEMQQLTIPLKDAQFLELKKYNNVDIGTRIYRLPPQMYGEYDKASTYASAEQFAIDYVTKTLRSWLVRLEQAYNMALLDPSERDTHYWEHNVEGLLRGDIASRYAAYAIGKINGWLNGDEIREKENMNPIPDEQGQVYMANGAMETVKTIMEGLNAIKNNQKPAEPGTQGGDNA